MPSEADHIALANENQEAMEYLIADGARFDCWIATIAFYKAIHAVEAVFWQNGPCAIRHSKDHKTRESAIKQHHAGLWKPYFRLMSVSRVARYMQGEVTNFARYMSRADLMSSHLNGTLRDLENRCVQLMSPSGQLAYRKYGAQAASANAPSAPGLTLAARPSSVRLLPPTAGGS